MDDFYDKYEDFMKNYDLSAGVPDWIYPPETPFKDTVNFWSIKSGPQKKPGAGKTTITCKKGKVVKKVTALKPVCPKGYKKVKR